MISVNQLQKELDEGKQFDGTITPPDGFVETGVHSIEEFEVWKTDAGLKFMYHEEPDYLLSKEEVEEVFHEKGDTTLDDQLKKCGIL